MEMFAKRRRPRAVKAGKPDAGAAEKV